MIERFRAVARFPNYLISERGYVWSLSRTKILKPSMSSKYGYPKLTMVGDTGKLKWPMLHSLVALAFIGERPAKHEVRHLDGNKKNAALSNLAYGLRSENNADRTRLGEWARGERHGMVKLREKQVVQIKKAIRSGAKTGELASKYGVCEATISLIRKGKNWKHVK